jgi:malonyl-CoA O-methyltransferase
VTLGVREAYGLWAEHYDVETAVTALEDEAARALTPALAGRALLDAGCGTGRRLSAPDSSACRLACGVDLVPAMLRAGRGHHALRPLAAADVRALPFPAATFDVVWCRLVLGHVRDQAPAYAELARVVRAAGTVIVTDFHPDAAAAGHARTFRDAAGTLHTIEHHARTVEEHVSTANAAGLTLTRRMDLEIGPAVRPFYERAGSLERYDRDRGLQLVLALRFTR